MIEDKQASILFLWFMIELLIGGKVIYNIKIDEAFSFYNIDNKYKKMCYDCINEINNSDAYKEAFNKICKKLYDSDFSYVRKLWDIKNVNELFDFNVNPFITNVIVLMGYHHHMININKYGIDNNQIKKHKKRVKECFESDLINRNLNGIRVSQMLWAIYFIRMRIIEVGRLQYEYYGQENGNNIIKIHIPKGNKLDILEVIKSLKISKNKLNEVFKINNLIYKCDSWLLSNQVFGLLDKDSNIYKFYRLFNVKDGKDCIKDILNFVYGVDICNDYSLLRDDTKLQKKIKVALLNNTKFKLGVGVLEKGIDFYENSNNREN